VEAGTKHHQRLSEMGKFWATDYSLSIDVIGFEGREVVEVQRFSEWGNQFEVGLENFAGVHNYDITYHEYTAEDQQER